ncbi:hypothetical protein [Chryseobacterium salviniae]|uniref:Lipoprotein n=1 Tax=Chryseobacterium salviniae TaxID=3101750 RepID=A0ABU6HRM9_9FLAO|nr:hypothetical protein [Chryseobacterium sp. T9W2-O]MEC3875700.1 hypothetical protein [Chryseobacterium sp. T9W2-O]
MRLLVYFFLFLFLSCRSQVGVDSPMHERQISFEDKNHYPFAIVSENFLIIDTQEKMDEVFAIIHQKNSGSRYSPIPAVIETETYLIIKPPLRNSNDVLINSVSIQKNELYVKIKEFQNPDLNKTSRISPNILLKLNEKLDIKKVTIQY